MPRYRELRFDIPAIPQAGSAPEHVGRKTFQYSVDASGIHVTCEEDGTRCIWAFPELIQWSSEIAWLFAYVASEGIGDLWGVDANGNLLIVENKRSKKGARLQDPFSDFLSPSFLDNSSLFQSSCLRNKWRVQLKEERDWIRRGEPFIESEVVRGVVPYSYHRWGIRACHEFYRKCLRPVILSAEYENRVLSFLARREERGDPGPVFVGLFTVVHAGIPGLSATGIQSYRQLEAIVGPERIHMAALRCRFCGDHSIVESVPVE